MTNRMACTTPIPFVIVVALGFAASSLTAQDSNYWTDQIGNRAQLLGGAVIASDRNLSAVYYNPGILGQGIDSELIITGNLFELKNVSVKETVAPERELSQTRFRALPALVAGEIYGKWLGNNRLAYSFFTRQSGGFDATSRFDATFGDEIAALEFFKEEDRINAGFGEYWGGFTWGRSLNRKHGLGASLFVAARSQSVRQQTVEQATLQDGTIGLGFKADDLSYYNYRLLAKLGYSSVYDGWAIGATLTTPSLSLFGSGSVAYDDSLVVSERIPGVNPRITTNFQDDLGATYKSPLSVGLGAARDFDPWSLHFSLEWFDSVDSYTVMDPEPFQSQTGLDVIETDVVNAAKSVTNFAIGLQRRFQSGVRAYGSIRSDFSADPGTEQENNLTASDWDLWHFGGGASFNISRTQMTLGLIYATGDSESQLVLSETAKLTYQRFTFILGIELPTGPSKQGTNGT